MIKVTNYRGLMQHCICDTCDWNIDISTHKDTPAECRKHVRSNPTHVVTRVVGSEMVYKNV